MLRIIDRKRWHPVGGCGTRDGKKTRVFIHHSAGTFGGSPQSLDTFAEQAEVMRRIDNFHTNSRGWAGIGYNYVVFQPAGKLRQARIFRARGGDYIPAAQLNDNTGTIAIVLVDGTEGNPLKPSTERQLIRLCRYLKKHYHVTGVGGHRDAHGQSTECPGKYIYPHISDIAKKSGLKRL